MRGDDVIGIICAMELEAQAIVSDMRNKSCIRISGVDFISGTVCSREAVVAVCGVGKVFAALCTQTMILRFSPELIINVGVGGTLTGSLHCGDIAVAQSVLQHDMDTSPLGDPRGLVSGINKINFTCDSDVLTALETIAERELHINCVRGIIASGDRFINSGEDKIFLNRYFKAIACDMESGAVGQVCYVNGVPFCIIRSISDEADGRSHMDYNEFAKKAADNASKLLKLYLKESL